MALLPNIKKDYEKKAVRLISLWASWPAASCRRRVSSQSTRRRRQTRRQHAGR